MKRLLFFIGLLSLCSCSKAQLNSPSWWGGLNTSECVGHIIVSTVPVPNPFPPPAYVPVVQTVWFNCSGEYTVQPHNFTSAPTDTKDAGLTRKVDTRVFADYDLTRYNAENGIKAKPFSPSNNLPSSLWLRPLGHNQIFDWFIGSYSYLVEKDYKNSIDINVIAHSSFTDQVTINIYDCWTNSLVYSVTTTGGTYNVSRDVNEKSAFILVEVVTSGQFHGSVTIN